MSTEIEINQYESAEAAVLLHHYPDAVVHHSQTLCGCKINHFTVMMNGGRLQGVTAYTREKAIEYAVEKINRGLPFMDRYGK